MTDVTVALLISWIAIVLVFAIFFKCLRSQTEVTVYDPETGNRMIEIRASSTAAALKLLDKVH